MTGRGGTRAVEGEERTKEEEQHSPKVVEEKIEAGTRVQDLKTATGGDKDAQGGLVGLSTHPPAYPLHQGTGTAATAATATLPDHSCAFPRAFLTRLITRLRVGVG